jgi:YbbR domain-containing protein
MVKKTISQPHIKILALLSAIVLWFIVITVENTIYPFPENIEVKISNLEKSLSLASDIPDAKLYLQVDKEELKRLTTNDFDVFVDLKGAQAETKLVPIIATSQNPLIKVLKVEPSEVEIKLSPTTEKEIDIEVNITGDPAKDYTVAETETDVDTVKISGAQSIIEEIDYITAELILDGTEKADLNQNVVLSLPKSINIRKDFVKFTPEQIVVSAKITSQLQSKDVSVIPKFQNGEDKAKWQDKISLDPATITIEGDDSLLRTISSIEADLSNVNDLNTNESIEVGFDLPEDISILNGKSKATVKLIASEIIEKDFQAKVKITNGDLTLISEPVSITVKLGGEREVIENIEESQIFVNLENDNLKDLGVVKLESDNINIPNGTQIVSFFPEEVAIKSNVPTI